MIPSRSSAFLKQLSSEPWISTPLFDHQLVARLVELGLIDAILKTSSETEHAFTAEEDEALIQMMIADIVGRAGPHNCGRSQCSGLRPGASQQNRI